MTHELAETRRFRQAWEGPASLRLRDRDETVLAEYHKHGRLLDCGPVERAEASAARAWLADTLTGHTSILVVDTNEQAARLSAAAARRPGPARAGGRRAAGAARAAGHVRRCR